MKNHHFSDVGLVKAGVSLMERSQSCAGPLVSGPAQPQLTARGRCQRGHWSARAGVCLACSGSFPHHGRTPGSPDSVVRGRRYLGITLRETWGLAKVRYWEFSRCAACRDRSCSDAYVGLGMRKLLLQVAVAGPGGRRCPTDGAVP